MSGLTVAGVTPGNDSVTVKQLSNGSTTTFASTGAIQTFTAPAAGNYLITADGAAGGGGGSVRAGGLGASAAGTFTLTDALTLHIVVGAVGQVFDGGGGMPFGDGGGSFVYDDIATPEPTSLALLAAGTAGLATRRGRRRHVSR